MILYPETYVPLETKYCYRRKFPYQFQLQQLKNHLFLVQNKQINQTKCENIICSFWFGLPVDLLGDDETSVESKFSKMDCESFSSLIVGEISE